MVGRRLVETLEHSTKYVLDTLHLALVHLWACCLAPAVNCQAAEAPAPFPSRRLSAHNSAKHSLAAPAENLLGQATCSYGELPGYWAHKANSTVGTWTLLNDECQLQVFTLLLSGTLHSAPVVTNASLTAASPLYGGGFVMHVLAPQICFGPFEGSAH